MAAIVRSGARRLAGSALLQRAPAAGAMFQRTQASGVDALRRPFLARLISSTKQHVDEIQKRKEELRFMRAAKSINDVIRPAGIVAGLVLGGASVTLPLSLEEVSQEILKEQKEEKKAAKEKQVAFS